MIDISQLSNEELQKLYQGAGNAGAGAPEMRSISNEDLQKLYADQNNRDPGFFGNLTNTAAKYMTFGLSDLAGAAGSATDDAIRGRAGSFGQNYNKALSRERGDATAFSSEHPIANGIAALAGAGASAAPAMGWPTALRAGAEIPAAAAAPTLGGRIGRGMLGGAGVGAASGFSNSPTGSVQDTLMGAGTGAVVGGGAPLIGELASIPINAFTRRFMGGADSQALDRISGRISQDAAAGGPGFSDLAQALAAGNGKPLALADVAGENTQSLAGRMTRTPGVGRETSTGFLGDRLSAMGPRLVGDLDTALPTGSAFNTAQDLMKQRATDAAPLYEKAFAGGSIAPLEHGLTDSFNQASGASQQAMRDVASAQQAVTTAAAKGSTAGNVYSSSAAGGAMRDANAQLAAAQQKAALAEQAKTEALARMQTAQEHAANGVAGAVWTPRIQQFLDDPIIQQGINKGIQVQRLEALAAGKPFDPREFAITGFGQDGSPMVSKVPNMRLLDSAKRGLDDILEGYRDPTSGKLNLDQYGRAVDQVRQSFLGELDRVNPDYAAARQAWAGPSSALSAMRMGQNFRSMRPEAIDNVLNGTTPSGGASMSPSQREFFRLGAGDALRQEVMRTGDPRVIIGTNAANNRGADLMKQQLRPLFDNPDAYDRFIHDVSNESLMLGNTGKFVGNSATAGRMAEDSGGGHGSGILGEGATMAGALALGEPMVAATRAPSFLRKLSQIGEVSANNPAVNAATASRLFTADPAANAQTLAELLIRSRYPSLSGQLALPAAAAAGSNPLIPLRVGGALAHVLSSANPAEQPGVQK